MIGLSSTEQAFAARRLHPTAARVLQAAVAIVERARVGDDSLDAHLIDWACWIVTANMPLTAAVRRAVLPNGNSFIVSVCLT